jgi:hypothetical protein
LYSHGEFATRGAAQWSDQREMRGITSLHWYLRHRAILPY